MDRGTRSIPESLLSLVDRSASQHAASFSCRKPASQLLVSNLIGRRIADARRASLERPQHFFQERFPCEREEPRLL